jgi:hypothetical protein
MIVESAKKMNRETVPPGLLMVADLIVRLPERKEELLAYELRKRERDQQIARETLHLLSWHPLHTTKVVLVYGITAFSIASLVGSIASLGQWFVHLQASKVPLSIPMVGSIPINIGSLVPTSTALSSIADLPVVSLRDSMYFGIAVALLVLIEKVIFIVIQHGKAQVLRRALEELDVETKALKEMGAKEEAKH